MPARFFIGCSISLTAILFGPSVSSAFLPTAFDQPPDLVSPQSSVTGSSLEVGFDFFSADMAFSHPSYSWTRKLALSLSLAFRPEDFLLCAVRLGGASYRFGRGGQTETATGVEDGTFLVGAGGSYPFRRFASGAFVALDMNFGSAKRLSEVTGLHDERGLFSDFALQYAVIGALTLDLSKDPEILPLRIHLNVSVKPHLQDNGSVMFPDSYGPGKKDLWKLGFSVETVGEAASTCVSVVRRLNSAENSGFWEKQILVTPSIRFLLSEHLYGRIGVRFCFSTDDESTEFDPTHEWPGWQGAVSLGIRWKSRD